MKPFIKKVVGICASQTHSLAWTDQGQLFSWGDAKDGKLGRKFNQKDWVSVEEVGRVDGLEEQFIIMAGCGVSYSLALTKQGKTYGWGRVSRILSEPCVVDIVLPQQLVPIIKTQIGMHPKFVKIVAGQTHFAALDVLGRIFTWGENIENCLGHLDDQDLLQPTEVCFQQDFKIIDIGVGQNFTTFIALNGKAHYESSYLRNIKQNSRSQMKEDIQLIKSYSKCKSQLEETQTSGFRKSLKNQQSTEDILGAMSSQRVMKTRFSTQQLQSSLWTLLQPEQMKIKTQTSQTSIRHRLNSGHLRYLQKNFGESYKLKNGQYEVVIDQITDKLWDHQKTDPLLLSLRQDQTKMLKTPSQKGAYKLDLNDFYSSPVGKEFDPVKQDLLKYQYIDMIRNGQEDQHFQYIFQDQPPVWKPKVFYGKVRLSKFQVSKSLQKEADKPFRNVSNQKQISDVSLQLESKNTIYQKVYNHAWREQRRCYYLNQKYFKGYRGTKILKNNTNYDVQKKKLMVSMIVSNIVIYICIYISQCACKYVNYCNHRITFVFDSN